MDIKCTQCGGQVPISEDTSFVRCPFCETALYVETDRTVSHQYLPATVAVKDLGSYLQRRLARFEVQEQAQIKSSQLIYFPFWRFNLATGKSVAVPAAVPPYEDLRRMKMPAGAYQLFDAAAIGAVEVIEPEALLEDAAREAREELENEDVKFTGAAIVHLPIYQVSYLIGARIYHVLIDAAAGEAYADDWPAGSQKEKDRALGMIAALCAVLFLVEAAVIPGVWLTFGAYAVTAAGIYYLARAKLLKMGW